MRLDIFKDESSAPPASPLREARLKQMVRRFCVLLGLTVLLCVGCELAALVTPLPSPVRLALAGENPFWVGGMFGISFLYFWSRPTVREFRCMVGGGLILCAVLTFVSARAGAETPLYHGINLGIGLAALAALCWHAWRSTGVERTEVLALLLPAFITVGSSFLLAMFFKLSPVRHETLDGLVYAADEALGFQASFVLGRVFEAIPLLGLVSIGVYLLSAVPILVVLGMQVRSPRPPLMDVYTITVAIAVAFSTVCLSFPVVGPGPAFGDRFPDHPPAVEEVLKAPLEVPDKPRNCMPSGHTAWAILIWWHARPFGRTFRALALGNLFFTVLATLGSGAQYLLDLVVAVPWVVVVQAVCTPAPAPALAKDPGAGRRRRWRTILFGILLTAAWLAVIRYGLGLLRLSSVLTDALALATVVLPLVLEYRLYRRMVAYEQSVWETG